MRKRTPKTSEEILKALQIAAKDKELLDVFLCDLLTPREYDEIALRWQIIQRLADKQSQWGIADVLGTGIATITRGARALRDKQGGFWRVLKKINS